MPLFHHRVISKHLKHIQAVDARCGSILETWAENLERGIYDSETQNDGEFIQRILIDILGYVGSSDGKKWTVAKNQPVGKGNVDVALGHFTADNASILAPLELKGAKTRDLDAIMAGRNKTPVQQAWEYAMDAKGAQWVLVSNYREIRLYAVGYGRKEYESFDLSNLRKPEHYARFMLLLSAQNLLEGKTLSLLKESEQAEKDITDQLYADYKILRRRLIDTISKDNPEKDPLDVIRYTQTILDRILFVAFAEDKGLLPDKTLAKAYETQNLFSPQPVWENFKGLFQAINKGNAALNIPGYNGGLFADDPDLNNLKISNELCESFKKIGEYDFDSDVSVNILGHIFEQSISDLEELKAETEGADTEFDKKKSKRKKDGIFYTPAYITRYIVEQSVGGWLADRRNEIGFDKLPVLTDDDFASIKMVVSGRGKNKTSKIVSNKSVAAHIAVWEAYKEALSQIKVLDPACGSGAFLNEVFDFLKKEGQTINNELARLTGEQTDLFRWDTHILANNIYGVDLNRESVEITKLSLWLKTANRNEKLTYLENNIKVGNSLIADPAIAGDLSFDWYEEFSDIMIAGGFDVVVGNPPYGADLPKTHFSYLEEKMKISSYQGETYIYFMLQSHDLLKDNGYCGFIVPNTWMINVYGQKIRHYILNELTMVAVQHYLGNVFAAAKVDSQTLITKKCVPHANKISVEIIGKNKDVQYKVDQSYWQECADTSINIYQSSLEIRKLAQKLQANEVLKTFFKVTQGTKPFQVGKGVPKQTAETLKTQPFVSNYKKDSTFVPLLRGSLINRYITLWDNDYWISFGDWLAEPRYSASYDASEKILIRQTGYVLVATLDIQQFIARDNLYTIVPKTGHQPFSLSTLCGLINSKLMHWYYQNVLNSEVGEGLAQVKKISIDAFPIPKNTNNATEGGIKSNVQSIMKMKQDFYSITSKFMSLLRSETTLDKSSEKLDAWYMLEFSEFTSELSKRKINLSLAQKSEWMQHFETEKAKALTLKTEIDRLDHEIDQMVYALYDLTPDEISIVEGNDK